MGRHLHYISRRFSAYPFRVYRALHSHGIYGNCDDASAYNSRLSTAHKARVALVGNTTITVDDDFSQDEMMRGLVQQALKTEVQKLDEELGNDYKAKQQVYRVMIARINREEREDEEGY